MDRINGYRIIDDYKYLCQTKGNRNTVLKITDGKIDYFFKMVGLAERYKELFFSILLNERGVDTVQIDFASYNEQFGIVSPSFNPSNLESDYIADIITECKKLEEYKEKILYNVQALNELIYLFCVKHHYAYVSLKKELFLKFIMQILLGNSDLNSNNIELLAKNPIVLSPHYDFESCGDINLKAPENYYSYMLKYSANAKSTETALETIQSFLQEGTYEEIETFKDWLEHMKAANTNRIIKMSEEQIEKRIPKDIKLQLVHEYKTNLKNVDSIVKGKWKFH